MQPRREKREELAAFQLIELHSIPASQGPDLQDIELARISQEVAERFYNLVAVGEGGRCPSRVKDGPILSQARSRSKGPLSDQVADARNRAANVAVGGNSARSHGTSRAAALV